MLDRYRKQFPWILLVGLAIVLVITVGYAGATSTAAFGPYTTTWEGTTELRSMADDSGSLVIARNTTAYGSVSANESIAIIMAPDERYTAEEVAHVQEFLSNGGTVLVAHSSATPTNDILASLGAEARIDGDPLRDETEYDASPHFPLAYPAGDHPLTDDVESISLNHGSAVTTDGNVTTLLESSPYAYLDRDRTQRLSEDEELDIHAVATIASIGDGSVIVVSDPSVFINVMLDRQDNRVFLHGLVASHETVVYDTTKTSDLPPLSLAVLVVREFAILQFLLGTIAIGGIWALFHASLPIAIRDRWLGRDTVDHEIDPETLKEAVREKYPDLDPALIDRVIDRPDD